MKIKFWGATDDVTGSMTFLELPSGTVLIDCGLAQGLPFVEKINNFPLPVKPTEIQAVIITHAHLDHCGYLPHLVKLGFRVEIFCTKATSKLIRIILTDSAKLDTDGFYKEPDVVQTLKLIRTYEWKEVFGVLDADFMFLPASHILGASSVKVLVDKKTLIFSGDLGRYDDPLLPPLEFCPKADVIVMESTYSGKNRTQDPRLELARFLDTVHDESRVGIIASFAVARAQSLLTLIHEYFQNNPNKKIKLVIDSPMMKEANKIYQQHSSLAQDPDLVFEALDHLDSIDYLKEWKKLKQNTGPLLVVASSGMLTGGRIHRYLENWYDDKRAILFLPGYQGEGTLGRAMVEGKRSFVNSHDEQLTWSGEVWTTDAFSSHADQNELIKWLGEQNKAGQIYLIHGELKSKRALKHKLEELGFLHVEIPLRGSTF